MKIDINNKQLTFECDGFTLALTTMLGYALLSGRPLFSSALPQWVWITSCIFLFIILGLNLIKGYLIIRNLRKGNETDEEPEEPSKETLQQEN